MYEEAVEAAKGIHTNGSKTTTTTTTPRILEGVPVSIKESIKVKGYDSTCGLASRVFQPSEVIATDHMLPQPRPSNDLWFLEMA